MKGFPKPCAIAVPEKRFWYTAGARSILWKSFCPLCGRLKRTAMTMPHRFDGRNRAAYRDAAAFPVCPGDASPVGRRRGPARSISSLSAATSA